MASLNNMTDITDIVSHINEDEYTHVGLLQKALDTISPNTDKALDAGKEQAEEILNTNETA